MVQKKEPRQEQNNYSPYYYPNFSRYNFPSNTGDEEKYTEYKFSFPHWDDEVQAYTPPTRLRRSSSSPLFCIEGEDYFNNKSLSTTTTPSDNEEDESEAICEEIQNDIDLARKDQKTDYDQFRKSYATFHDDIRALQREIEAIEAVCMKNGWDLKRGGATNDEFYYNPEPTCIITSSANTKGGSRLATMPSAAAAARGMISKKRSSPSILYKNKVTNQQQDGNFNDNNNNNNSNNRRCLGIEDGWSQERVQNEWIRC